MPTQWLENHENNSKQPLFECVKKTKIKHNNLYVQTLNSYLCIKRIFVN